MEKDIPGWFPKTNQEVLEQLIKDHDIKTVIEIGSFVGLSTVFFAERCEKVYAIEPFNALENCDYLNDEMKKIAENQRAEYDKNTEMHHNILTLSMTSEQAHDNAEIFLEADLIYIDGAHDFMNVQKDIMLWLPRAKKILCGDDYTPQWPEVRRAVDDITSHEVNKENRVWYLVK